VERGVERAKAVGGENTKMSERMILTAPAPARTRKLVLSPANRAKVLAKLPAPIATEIKHAEQMDAVRIQKQERLAAQHKLEALLRECFPAAFHGPPRQPLAIGIHAQILDVAGGEIDRHELARFMRWWCTRYDYLDAIAHGEMRVNLVGEPAGVPSQDEQEHAARRLFGPWADRVMAKIAARA
jgi:ProQ/FINO family